MLSYYFSYKSCVATSLSEVLIIFSSYQHSLFNLYFLIVYFFENLLFKDTLKAFDNFKNNQNSVWSNGFWYVKVCIFWKYIQYTIDWDKTQMLKKFSLDSIDGTKNALFFLSRALTNHSFFVNLRFLYELKHHRVPLSKTVCGIVHYWFRFVFIKVYIFVQQNIWTLWL